jgi:hypothetical protein
MGSDIPLLAVQYAVEERQNHFAEIHLDGWASTSESEHTIINTL